jgi:putative hemolysin
MGIDLCILTLIAASVISVYFSVLTYALRDFSRAKLAEHLGRHDGDKWFEALTEHTDQFIFVTAVVRMLANLLTWASLFAVMELAGRSGVAKYLEAFAIAAVVSLVCSIAVPLAVAKYAAEGAIAVSAGMLGLLATVFSPLIHLTALLNDATRRALGVGKTVETEEIEQEILSVVEEGEKDGVMDEQERELIENVIEFRESTAGQIMTARTDIVGLESTAGLEDALAMIESSGHSRLPVYEQSLDKIVGILYARDLIKLLGQSGQAFDMRKEIRSAMFVPETKPLRNLLNDFRQQKVHIAIVLDEYGGTAGLVTIEDVLEELVGEISDEHEPLEPAMFRKTADGAAEADARLTISELNRQLDLSLPMDAGYETLGGFLISGLGRIGQAGSIYEYGGARFTVIDAEPRKINRVKIELAPKT